MEQALFVIPARGGSKGIPGKNLKLLGGKPLLQYTLDVARTLVSDESICVSTDDGQIAEAARQLGYTVPFLRPAHLASDIASTYDVLLHALQHYEEAGKKFEQLVLLQPTSPFRTAKQVQEALALFSDNIDMVVSVKETKSNPYYVLMEEDEQGWLHKSKEANITRRQDAPPVYEVNGAIYVMNVKSLKKQPVSTFSKIKKYLMSYESSIDIDTPLDWKISELLIRENIC